MSVVHAAATRRGYYLLALVVVVVDQATKALAHAYLPGTGQREVVPGLFSLWYSRNRGGLFGMFRDWPAPWRGILLTLLPLAALALIAFLLARTRDEDRWTLTGLGLILGGAVGNLIDRLFRGEVVDFLDVYASHPALAEWLIDHFGTEHWPTFNVADSAIVIGACLLALAVLLPARQEDASGAGARS